MQPQPMPEPIIPIGLPPMTRRNRFQGHWTLLLAHFISRAGMTGVSFATKVGLSQQGFWAYQAGKVRPPLDSLPQWAALLGLSASETREFIHFAHELHVPETAWVWLQEARKALAEQAKERAPSDLVLELREMKAALARALTALRTVDAFLKKGRGEPPQIRAAIQRGLAATPAPATAETHTMPTGTTPSQPS